MTEGEKRRDAYEDLVRQICADVAKVASTIDSGVRVTQDLFTVKIEKYPLPVLHCLILDVVIKYVDLVMVQGDYRVQAAKEHNLDAAWNEAEYEVEREWKLWMDSTEDMK